MPSKPHEFCKRGHLMAETRRYYRGCSRCIECDKARERLRKLTPEQRKRKNACAKRHHLRYLLKHTYGLTLEEYGEMVAVQGGRCAICNKLPKGTNHTSGRLAIDHDHATGAVRGLLCGTCNTAIARIEDSPGLLDRMRRYLGKHAQLHLVEKK